MNGAPAKSGRAKLALAILAVLFFGGMFAAYALVQSGWRPGATKNYGELVQPARPVRDVLLTDLDGRAVRFSTFQGKWLLLYFGPADCPRACIDNLYKMRQLVAAQGRESYRVQRLFILTDPKARDRLRSALAEYPQTHVLFGTPEAVRELASQFSVAAGTPLDGLHRLYVVDPRGNFMMSYPADADLQRMNKDLGLLLRASYIG